MAQRLPGLFDRQPVVVGIVFYNILTPRWTMPKSRMIYLDSSFIVPASVGVGQTAH
jgi:hypothetical protein